VLVDSGGTLIMNARSKITGNSNNAGIGINAGGGVRVNHDGWFIMNGGEISGNIARNSGGGGVFVASGSVFEMRGGAISGNESGLEGGGVHVANGGTFNMHAGVFTGNRGRFGGGVHNAGNFRISNGVIHGRNATLVQRNTLTWAGGTGAALHSNGLSQYGTFDDVGFIRRGDLFNAENTVHVILSFLR
jgi:hypothetical protein